MLVVPLPGEVDDLESLTVAQGCSEAVLAVDLGDVYVFALGHPDVVDALADHLRD